MTTIHWPLFQWYGAVFGGRALELAGRVVHPLYQRQGLASHMLADIITSLQPEIIATYTRNPSILRIMNRVASVPYPITRDAELHDIAQQMEHATDHNGDVYHFNRYGEQGLFRAGDPADRPYSSDHPPFKQQFSELTCVRHALVAVARTRRQS